MGWATRRRTVQARFICASKYKRPFTLIGEDHFHQILHNMACYSAPFHNEDGTEIIGTISLMTHKEYAHPHLYALLCTMADSLEREIVTRKRIAQLQTLNQVLLRTNHYGVIITDAKGRILEMNQHSLRLLYSEGSDKDRDKYINRSVFDLKPIGEYYERVIYQQEICIGKELSLEISGSLNHYILDVQPAYDRGGETHAGRRFSSRYYGDETNRGSAEEYGEADICRPGCRKHRP